MAQRVLRALTAVPAITAVSVVTACEEVGRFAAGMGAAVIHQDEDGGTAAAFAHAVATLRRGGLPARTLMIAGDLPLIAASDLMSLANRQTVNPGVLIVPDRKRIGTNALLCSPPDAIEPRFGAESFQGHVSAARAAGVPYQVVESPALSLDIDVADDLELLRNCGGFTLDRPAPVMPRRLTQLYRPPDSAARMFAGESGRRISGIAARKTSLT